MITGYISGQELRLSTPALAADSIKYLEAEFHFAGHDWDGYAKTAYFINGESKFALTLTDDRISADMGLNLTEGEWEVKLSGVKDGSRITTTTQRIYVRGFGSTDGELPDVTATLAEQLQSQIGSLSDLETEDKTSLVAAVNEAAKSAGGEGGAVQSVNGKTGEVELSAEDIGAMQPNGEYDTDGLVLNNTGTGAYDVALACQGVWNGKFRQSAIANAGVIVTTCKGETVSSGLLEQLILNPNNIDVCDFKVSPNKYLYLTANGIEIRNKAYPIVLKGKHIDASSTQMKNVAAPTDDTDAANKKYVDDAVAQAGGSGADLSLGVEGAKVGQTVEITEVDSAGRPTAWQPVDMPSGGGETWELIRAITIADDAAETNALTINTDDDGNAFALKKARLIQNFAKYTGETTVPSWSFTMVNGIISGAQSPLVYTSGLATPNKSAAAIGVYEIDLTMPGYQVEQAWRWSGSAGRGNFVPYYGTRTLNGAEAITSIGGTVMLIYPGCKFWLYGVRT